MTRFALFAALASLAPALGYAQTPIAQQPLAASPERRTMTALRVSDGETIVLDGRFVEPVWGRAVPAGNFIQQDPDNGRPATEQTEVRIVFSRTSLYMAVTCFDSEPGKWLGYQRRRDEGLQADDRFMWTIDTYLDGRTAYFFEMNPSGLMGDALQGADNVSNRQWDGIWIGVASRTETGWTLEIEIPFRTLNFNPTSDTWGINFQRTVRRKNEESVWMGWARNQGLRRMTNAGLVTGISDVSQGRGLDIKPYLVGTLQSSPGRGDSRTGRDGAAGVDVFYNPTPGLRANLTVNTDFAQTEVDQRQLNLTRFSLFFPEKRDFFLDGSTFFQFGAEFAYPGEWTPFFSRRVGLDQGGQPQKINFGAKLTGQLGTQDLGLLQVQTADEGANAGEDFTVVRLKRRILRQSYVGGIYTRRAARGIGADDRHTAGLDFNFATATFLGSQNLTAEGFYLDTTNPLETGKESAFGFRMQFPNDPWNGQFIFTEVEENYDAAIGYTPRTGFRRLGPIVSFSPRPVRHPWIRRFSFGSSLNWLMDPDTGRTLTREVNVTALLVELHSQDLFQIHVLPAHELLETDFRISPGITLPTGREYRFTRYRVQASTANRRLVAVAPTVEWGRFYSGDRMRTALDVTVRVRPGLIAYLSGEWNQIDLAEGRFQTRLYRGIVETQFNPWIALVNNVQYDTQSAVVGWQSRFRWIVKPGNDFYLVYLHNWLDDPVRSRFATLDRRAASKFMYTHRF
jgi:hypothetical protein